MNQVFTANLKFEVDAADMARIVGEYGSVENYLDHIVADLAFGYATIQNLNEDEEFLSGHKI
jgi:hypothetical protein